VREGRSSRTAEHNALFRALESLGPPGERIVDDPLAAAFLSPDLRAVARAARVRPLRTAVVRTIDRRWPGVRTSVVARTRLIDDTIATLTEAPAPTSAPTAVVGSAGGRVAQAVLLGAGFDTRPYRLPALAGMPVFEVDHPDTQRRKRDRLSRAVVPADHVRFVPADLARDPLDDVLAAAGHDRSTPALVLWEGVTNYLDAAAVDATLGWCAGAAPGSHLVFTYVDRRALDEPGRYAGAERVFATLRRSGEPMTFGLDPERLDPYLRARGLALELDLGAAEFRRRYFGPAAERMVGHEFYRVAHVRVAGAARP
jgi:methyltransferase (TIGR00027 family)